MKSLDFPTRSMPALSLLGSTSDCEGLFAASREAVLIVDASTERIAEANPSALQLLGATGSGTSATELSAFFEPEGVAALRAGMTAAHVQQRAALIGLRLRRSPWDLNAQVSMFRTASHAYFLVRLAAVGSADLPAPQGFPKSATFNAIDVASFGFVLTDAMFRIEYANHAFATMTGRRSKAALAGSLLDHWLTLTSAARADLDNQLVRRIALTHFMSTLPGPPVCHVAVEAICAPAGPDSSWAFVINQTSAPH